MVKREGWVVTCRYSWDKVWNFTRTGQSGDLTYLTQGLSTGEHRFSCTALRGQGTVYSSGGGTQFTNSVEQWPWKLSNIIHLIFHIWWVRQPPRNKVQWMLGNFAKLFLERLKLYKIYRACITALSSHKRRKLQIWLSKRAISSPLKVRKYNYNCLEMHLLHFWRKSFTNYTKISTKINLYLIMSLYH